MVHVEYLRGGGHVYRHVAGEHLLVSIRGDSDSPLFAMTPTAAALWARLGEWATIEQLVSCLTERFDVTADKAAGDVEEFLEQLQEIHALARRGESNG